MNTTLRKTIKTIDSHLFSGIFRKLNLKYKRHRYTNKMHSIFQYNNNVCITSKQQNYLGELFDRYGSDKGYGLFDKTRESPALHYNDIYELMFFQHKYQTKLILECGIGGKSKNTFPNMAHHKYSIPGGSLRAWRSYFPNAQVVGIDIDPDTIFTEDRINTYVCDQTKAESIKKFINQANLQANTVDIIIDDGLHEFNANITLFENTKQLLKNNGIYVIEDFWIINQEQQKFIDYFSRLDSYNVVFIKMSISYLIVITKND